MIVFISGSTPDLFVSAPDDLRRRMHMTPSVKFYPEEEPWLNAPLLLAGEMRADLEASSLHVVGVGRGADIDFLRRLNGISSQGSGPVEPTVVGGEQHLVEVLEFIFSSGQAKIVQ